mgnify:CR=1 FL=1
MYVLCILSLLVVLVGALVGSVRHDLNLTWQYSRKNGALYAAEAGVSMCMSLLEDDESWSVGFDHEPLEGGQGTYTVTFFSGGGTPGPLESVNNLDKVTWANSYRGPNTVPPYSALLVVTGEYGGVTKSVDVLVQPGGGANLDGAALVSGRINLAGNVVVLGKKTYQGNEYIPGHIHSNLVSDESDLVTHHTWGGVYVSGKVSSSGLSDHAIRFPRGVRTQTNAPVKPIPYVDIEATIAEKRNKPKFGYTKDDNGYSSKNGEFYVDGDLTTTEDGNLILDNTKLYVKGNLKINGTVQGTGSVFVGGETTLMGNTSITTSDGESFVALFSKGRVHLKGNESTAPVETDCDGHETKTYDEDTVEASGKASFVGLVYTNGSLYAEQNVSVYGSIIVRDDGSQQPETLDVKNGGEAITVAPGELRMEQGAEMVYIEEFFQQSRIFRYMRGLGVTSWLEH